MLPIRELMAQLQLRNLTKRWGDVVAVRNFNLDIQDREFIVLLGPSGCGKTTTSLSTMPIRNGTGDLLTPA